MTKRKDTTSSLDSTHFSDDSGLHQSCSASSVFSSLHREHTNTSTPTTPTSPAALVSFHSLPQGGGRNSGAASPKWSSQARGPPYLPAHADCDMAQQLLVQATRDAAARLGNGHPYVEEAKRRQQQYRRQRDQQAWKELMTFHENSIASALQVVEDGGDVSQLEAAVRHAQESELGFGHRIVAWGKTEAERWRKQRTRDAFKQVEFETVQHLRAACEGGDLHQLLDRIDAGSKAVGSGHPEVEFARRRYKEFRDSYQRAEWDDTVKMHAELMMNACASNDPDLIEERIQGTMASELGMGHQIVQDGKSYLLILKKSVINDRDERERQECLDMLEAAYLDTEDAFARYEGEAVHH